MDLSICLSSDLIETIEIWRQTFRRMRDLEIDEVDIHGSHLPMSYSQTTR